MDEDEELEEEIEFDDMDYEETEWDYYFDKGFHDGYHIPGVD